MPAILVPTIIVGAALLAFTIYVLRTVLAPRRIEAIAEMLRQGKVQAAARAARAIVTKDPRNVDARFLLGQAYVKDEKSELALMEMKAINQIGKFGEVATELVYRKEVVSLYERYDQVDEALKECLLLVKMEPDKAEHYFRCAGLFEKRGDPERAVKYYIRAIQLDPNLGEGHYRLGVLLYRQKKTVDARNELTLAIKHDADNAEAHFYLGRMLKDAGDYTGALASLERAQKSPELKVRALVERGGTYMSMKNYERAVSDLTRAIRLAPEGSSQEVLYGHYFLALCYEKARKLEKAIEHWEYIYAKRPGFRDVAEKLSQYQDLRTDDSIKDYVTSSEEEFTQMCHEAAEALNLSVRDTSPVPNGCQIIATESASKWRNARRITRVIWFLRVPEVLTDSAVRSLLDHMRKANIPRGTIFTSSSYSRSAREYAQSRPIDLCGKEELQRILPR